MPIAESIPGKDPKLDEVLTLAEVAAYLRVSDDALLDLVNEGTLPAQKIGGEWRFLKRGVHLWLLSGGPRLLNMWPFHPAFLFDPGLVEEMVQTIKKRVVDELKQANAPRPQPETPPRPGSKEAILKYSGVFKDEKDLEEQLAYLRALREAT